MPWYKQSGAFQRRAAVNHQLRWPFARGDGELPLLKAGKSAILGPKPPESGECRINRKSEMHRLGPQQASYGFSLRLLIGLCVAALGLGLTCGTGVAAPVRQVSSAPVEDFCASDRSGRILRGDPSNYRRLLPMLTPGDTLVLAPGPYRLLTIAHINGAPGRCVTITGPATGPRAVIVGEIGSKTAEIIDSSYVVVSNLTIDSRGIPGADGIKAPVTLHPATHHIVLDNNLIVGAGANQQNDGISTKTPTWNWVIRRNTIVAAGTAIYLEDFRRRPTLCRRDH